MSLTRNPFPCKLTPRILIAIGGLVLCCGLQAQQQSIALEDLTQLGPNPHTIDDLRPFVDPKTATISSKQDARALLAALSKGPDPRFFKFGSWPWRLDDPNFYCIIHVVYWGTTSPQKPEKQNWYLYRGAKDWAQDDFTTGKRIFGVKKLAFVYLYIHRKDPPEARYEFSVTSKLPANVQHLFNLAGNFAPAAEGGSYQNYYGLADFNISFVPSDISATPYTVADDGTRSAVGDSVIFDNEGKYWWDVSVAVPVRKMGQLQFNNVNNTVTAQNPDKKNVFAILDLYPFKKDVKSQTFDLRPYAVAGVAVGSQPLHKILVGMGWGPKFAQFYVGALFVRQQDLKTLSEGSMATPAQQAADARMAFKPQFAFGINLPVRDVFQAVTSKTSKTAGPGTPANPSANSAGPNE